MKAGISTWGVEEGTEQTWQKGGRHEAQVLVKLEGTELRWCEIFP